MKPIPTNALRKLFTLMTLLAFLPMGLVAQEICDNALDDDGDGLVDFQDDDCTCEFIEIRSLIPNPSFENMNCCPDQHYRLDCAPPWIQAYGVTPDYIHTCDWLGPENIAVPTPFPDGDGIIGFVDGRVPQNLPIEYDWKEYAGVCLLGTMEAGKTYRIEFSLGFAGQLRSPPLEFTIFGTSDCANFPFGITDVLPGCPTNYPEWVRLEGKLLDGGSDGPTWVNDYFEFTPDQDIRAIAIGPPCAPFSADITHYYFMDNLIMEETFLFQYQIFSSGDICAGDYLLQVDVSTAVEYQWYKDSIALVGETGPTLSVDEYGNGNYQIRMIEPDGCRMSPPFSFERPAVPETEVEAILCPGEVYTDNGFSADSEGSYRYILPASTGCDSIINLTLKPCQLYLPNVFSPNRDGVNDTFRVFDKQGTTDYTIYIFDRWGNQVFEGQEWNGQIKGKPANQGVYLYYVQLTTVGGESVVQQGSVTLIR